jgi:hypothetical protein
LGLGTKRRGCHGMAADDAVSLDDAFLDARDRDELET